MSMELGKKNKLMEFRNLNPLYKASDNLRVVKWIFKSVEKKIFEPLGFNDGQFVDCHCNLREIFYRGCVKDWNERKVRKVL